MITQEEKRTIKRKSHKALVWVGILSIVMFFGGIASAYIVQSYDGTWVKITVPKAFYTSTIVIVLSSVSYIFAVRSVKQGKQPLSTLLVLTTLLLGLAFSYFQYQGWKELNLKGHYLGGDNKITYLLNNENAIYGEDYVIKYRGEELVKHENKFYYVKDRAFSQSVNLINLEAGNNAASYFYILTGLHLLHLLGGIISLLIVLVKSKQRVYTPEYTVGIEASALYWHFLDFLWLTLLLLLYVVG